MPRVNESEFVVIKKVNNPVTQVQNYFDKVKIIKGLMDEAANEASKDNNFDVDKYEIKSKIDELDKLRSDILDKFIDGLGYIYEGVLIDNKLSIRKDGVYRFKCRYTPDKESIINDLIDGKEQILHKVKDAKPLLEVLNAFIVDKEILFNNHSANDTFIKIEPTLVLDKISNDRYSDNPKGFRYQLVNVNTIFYYDDGSIRFVEAPYKNNEPDHYSSIKVSDEGVIAMLVKKFLDNINKQRDLLMVDINLRKDKLNKLKDILEEKLGKYILLAEIKSEAIIQ